MKRTHCLIMSMLCFAVALVSAFLIPAYAADAVVASGTPLGEALSGFMTGTVFPLVNAFLAALIGWAVLKIGKKYKIDALIGSEFLIQEAARKGIALAEEMAANRLKTSRITMTSSSKLNLAVAQVLKAAPKLTQIEAEGYVESILARTKGVGAIGDKAV